VAALSVNASAGAMLQGECSVELPNLALPGVPLYVITIAPRINPSLGIDASAVATAGAGWVSISGLERTWTFDAGVRHTNSAGWTSFKSFNSTGPEPDSGTFSLSGELDLAAQAGVNVGVGLDVCLTACLPWTVLVNAEFIQVFGGPFWDFGIATPLDPADPDYLGPQLSAGVGAEATAGLEVSFFDSGLLGYLGVGGSAGISFPIFSEQFEFIGTPALAGSLTCSPNCTSMPTTGGTLDLQMTAPAAGTGTAEFWIGPPGGNLTLLGTAPFDSGQSTGSFSTGALAEGTYEIYPRLGLDSALFWFSSIVPIASSTPIGSFSVAQVETSLSAIADAGLRAGAFGNQNYGGDPDGAPEQKAFSLGRHDNLFVDAGLEPVRGAMKFDLSGIPAGAHIDNATLTMQFLGGTSSDSSLELVFTPYASIWNESSITWNNRPSLLNSASVSGVFPASGFNPTVNDLTEMVQAWVDGAIANHGFEISIPEWESESFKSKDFYQKEWSANLVSTLKVSYTAP